MIRPALRRPPRGLVQTFKRNSEQRLEALALRATDTGSRDGLARIRTAMASARLGRLGNALGAGSDLRKNGRVHRTGTGGFRASGWIYIRSRSERAIGAIEAYTEGAEILPKRGRWLWIATDEIPARAGRYRMTPERYRTNGFEQKIGPLQPAKSINGRPLLVVKNASVNAFGKRNSAKSLTKRGRLRKGQRGKEFIVAFYAILRTSRAARVDVRGELVPVRRAVGDTIIRGLAA